jgi:hypothetical protein
LPFSKKCAATIIYQYGNFNSFPSKRHCVLYVKHLHLCRKINLSGTCPSASCHYILHILVKLGKDNLVVMMYVINRECLNYFRYEMKIVTRYFQHIVGDKTEGKMNFLALDDALIIYFRMDLICITHSVMIGIVVAEVVVIDVIVEVVIVVVEVSVVVVVVADVVVVVVDDVVVVVVDEVVVVVAVVVVVGHGIGEVIIMNVTQYSIDCTNSLNGRRKKEYS